MPTSLNQTLSWHCLSITPHRQRYWITILITTLSIVIHSFAGLTSDCNGLMASRQLLMVWRSSSLPHRRVILEASSISRKVTVAPNTLDSGDPLFSLGKVDATLALGDAREVRDIFWASRQFYGCRYGWCGLVQQSGDFIDCVIFESYKNGIGDLTKASGYKLELCSISSVCEGDEVSGAGSGALSAYLHTCA